MTAALFAILLSALDAGPTAAPRVSAPSTVTLGETFDYAIAVPHPGGEVFAFPQTLDLGDFEVVDRSREESTASSSPETILHLKLRAWGLGKSHIPPVLLDVQGPSGLSHLSVPGPEVEISGTLDPDGGADAPMRDIAPPVAVRVRTYRVLAWAAGLAALLLAGWALRRRLNRPRPVVAPVVPVVPAEERAEGALSALMAEDLPSQGLQREFFFRLSEIVRRYLGERFAFDAIDLTSDELLSVLSRRQTPGLDYPAFAQFCRDADLAKFAKLQPDVGGCKASMDAAFQLVRLTTAAGSPEKEAR